jgi:hypothetical protein
MINAKIWLPMALWLPACAAMAAPEITEPTEVGTTTMPSGEYTVTERSSQKTYSLMVTSKGNMILGPTAAVPAVSPKPSVPTATVPAPAAAVVAPVTPAAVAPGAVAPGVVAPGAVAPGTLPSASNSVMSSAVKSLVQKGMTQGMNQLMKSGATKQLNKYIK